MTAASEIFLKAVIRRDRILLLASLFAVLALAWGWLIVGTGMGMGPVELAGMDGALMQPAVWTPAYTMLMYFMWWVMMVAMMLPSATPMLLLFACVSRKDKGSDAPLISVSGFAAGYVIAWSVFSLSAVGLQWTMESARLMSPMLETTNVWRGAVILVAAGLWQLTPMKTVCLRHCRSPLGFLIGNWRAGRWGALRMGLEHGAYCLGCCWFLMGLLFFGGIMNLFWIVGLAAFVLLEKTIPLGHWLGRTAGVVLVLWGLSLPVL